MTAPSRPKRKCLFGHDAVLRTARLLDEAVVDFMMWDAYSPRMYDSNLHWVKVTVARPEEVDRVHAAISKGLHRSHLRPPIGDVVVVEFGDRHKTDGAEAVRYVIEQGFGNPEWIQIEVGHGNARWIYGPYPEGQRYLHEVMLSLLKDRPDGMTPAEISEAVARDGLFVGPRSSHVPEPGQISARASNRRELFEVRGGRIYAR